MTWAKHGRLVKTVLVPSPVETLGRSQKDETEQEGRRSFKAYVSEDIDPLRSPSGLSFPLD